MGRRRMISKRSLGAAMAVVMAYAGMTACAAKAGPSVAAADGSAGIGASCGKVSYQDPGGSADLTSLPKAIRDGYNGYFAPINTSVYKNFKSRSTGHYRIGYSDSFAANSWRGDVLSRLRTDVSSLTKDGVVSSLQTSNSNLDNSLQIQQITSMINQHVDAIIAIPNSPTAFNGVIKQAYDAGIPFITVASHVTSPYAINIDTNYHLTGELVAAGIAKTIQGKGDVLVVDGINGSPASATMHDGYLSAFKNCPAIKVAGSLEGQWSEATAKSVTLQYLSTHPSALSAIVNDGGMTNGILQALQQTGHQPVPIGDANPDEGSLVSLNKALPDKYVASTMPPAETIDAAVRTTIAVLQGQGLKYDTVVANPPQITGQAALTSWIQSGWTSSSAAQAPAPPGTPWLPASQMGEFFAHPKPLPQLP